MIYKFWFLKRNPIRTQFQQLILLIALCGSLPCLSQNTFTFDEEQLSNLSIDQLLALLDKGESIAGKTLVMNEIRFEFGQANLTEEAKIYLDKVVRLLTAIPSMNLTIAGHTDNVGDPSANLKLSQARALSVYNYLIERGVLVTRLSHEGYGDTRPIADNQSEQGRERNRRVEFGIVQSNQAAENSQMQDVIYLTDGIKIGAYNLTIEGDSLYYYSFQNPNRQSIRLDNVGSIDFRNGQHYQKPSIVEAPPPSRQSPTSNLLDRIYMNGIYGTIGFRTWHRAGRTIDFLFIDDSPSMDNISNRLDLPRGGLTIDGGLEWTLQGTPLDFVTGLNGHFGKIRGFNLLLGAGYRIIDQDNLIVRPGLSWMTGRGTMKLGEIENNDLFIQINEQEYYGETVEVKLRKPVNVFHPHVAIDMPKYRLRGQFGFNIQSSSKKDELLFTGEVDGSDVTERKLLSTSSSSFTVDGKAVSTFPVKFSGVYFQIGFIIR